jgi:uncharacterized repeat protein (TIGR01451 family)
MHNLKGGKGVTGGLARTSIALLALVVFVVLLSTTAVQAVDDSLQFTFEDAQAVPMPGTGIVSEPKGAAGSEIYLIRLSDPPVASYRGGIPGLQATNPAARGVDKLDMEEPAAVAYIDYLKAEQAELVTAMERTLGRSVEVVYQYYAANNGIAAYLTPEEAREVAKLPGVIFVQRNFERELHTDNGPTWIGAPSIWGTGGTTSEFEASLDGAQVVPPSGSDATGTGSFIYHVATNELSWNITHNINPQNPAQWFAYIRHAAPGANGPDVVAMGNAASPIIGSAVLTEQAEGWLLSGELYVEIQRETGNIRREIRGQILPVAGEGNMGEGIIIGVIDTGINPSNPSFADVGDDGYDHTNPWGAGNYVGVCDPGHASYDPTFVCNDKLIGAWGFPTVNGGDPRDYDGHGSHTASTAGGNFVFEAPVVAPTITITPSISGVAPHANIVAYAGCCTLAALTAAIDQVVVDAVDVVNYSIGGGSSDPWNDFDSLGFLAAREAGIFVATSAGNSGPGAATMGSPADAPWILSVGASTHGRSFLNVVEDMSGGDTPPPADIGGKGLTDGYGPAPIVYAGDYPSALTSTPELCGVGTIGSFVSPWPAGTFNGEIVVCDRGIFGRVEKGFNVAASGAGGMVLANVAANGEGFGTLSGDSHYLPAVHIANADGLVLKEWLASGSGHTATISGMSFSGDYGDIMAGFSSRGANPSVPDYLVPSVTAPGVDIIAAYGTDDSIEWNVVSGTSMASPHAAGAAALLMATNPGWSPAEIQSAMMTTAYTGVWDNDGVTPASPFAMGSGRVDLTAASTAGLVLDVTIAEYLNAEPALGGDPKDLNLASFGNSQCVQSCSWTRTVKSVAGVSVEWTASSSGSFPVDVQPASFTLAPGATQEIVVTADVSGQDVGSWTFAEVMLTPDDAAISAAHFPVGVVPSTGTLPALIDIQTRRDAGSQLAQDLTAIEITELTVDVHGLAKADFHEDELIQIISQGTSFPQIFFENLDRALVAMTDVPADSLALIYEVVATASPDLDMLVGFDANSNGMPDLGEQVCQSAAGGSFEYCEIANPDEGAWWAIVINFEASGAPPDPVTVAAAVIPSADNGNMWVEGPESVPALDPFDIRVFWDIPGMEPGDLYYGAISLGTDPANPGNVGMIRVDLERLEDDVAKTADVTTAEPGDTVNYTITVLPNVLPEDVTYWITDTIPAGMTYVPGSAMATEGTVEVTGDTLTWTGEMPQLSRRYVMSTSNEDASCVMPLANSGAYLNLQEFNIFPQAAIAGDTIWFSAFTSGAPINYWGTDHTGINFTDDGMAFFSSTPGTEPWVNQSIPHAADPNNLLAMFWNDFEVIYDAATNRGVSLANLGGTGAGGAILIEYDDVAEFGSTDPVMDFEVLVWRTPFDAPGNPEIIFAFDNIAFTPATGTIGIENADGTAGIQYAYDNAALATISNGMAICFDWYLPPGDPVEITYAVTVDAAANGTLTNAAQSTTSNQGSKLETASVDVLVQGTTPFYGVELSGDQAQTGLVDSTVTYNLVVTNTGNTADSFTLTVDSVWDADLSDTTTGSLNPGETFDFTVDVTVPDDAADGATDVATVTATSDTDDTAFDTAELTTTATTEVVVEYGVELVATTTAQSGYVGTSVVYTVDITNTGDAEDTFAVTLSGNSWTTAVAPTNVTLDAGESDQLTVTVQIPAGAAHGAQDTVTVTATSAADATATDSVQLTTTAQHYRLFLPLIAKEG